MESVLALLTGSPTIGIRIRRRYAFTIPKGRKRQAAQAYRQESLIRSRTSTIDNVA